MQEHDSSKKTNKLASLKLDADLSTLLQNASVHIQGRTRSLSEKIDKLDQKMKSVQTNVRGMLAMPLIFAQHSIALWHVREHMFEIVR